MSNKIFCKEYFNNAKALKNRVKAHPGYIANFKSDKDPCLKNDKINIINKVSIYYYLSFYFLIIIYNSRIFKKLFIIDMNNKKKILSSFSSYLDNLDSFYNPFNLYKLFILIFLVNPSFDLFTVNEGYCPICYSKTYIPTYEQDCQNVFCLCCI
jgi:hypothetical protein